MRTRCLMAFLLLIALVCTGLCDEFGFVNPPRHRRLRSAEEEVIDKLPTELEVIKPEATDENAVDTEEPVAETPSKDPHIKIIVHSTSNCPYCVQMMHTLKAFEDKYEIVEEKHNSSFKPDYSYYYVTGFPYVEYLYDGKVKLYHYGSRTENQIKNYIEQISR